MGRILAILRSLDPAWRRATAKRRLEKVCREQGASKAQAVRIAAAFFASTKDGSHAQSPRA